VVVEQLSTRRVEPMVPGVSLAQRLDLCHARLLLDDDSASGKGERGGLEGRGETSDSEEGRHGMR
jgi:hypothetical protein